MRNLLCGGLVLLVCCSSAAVARDALWERLPWDERVGIAWHLRLAERGDVDAQARLGLLYEEGVGVEDDPEAARRWYRAAAEQGHARAAFRLAWLLQDEAPGEAVEWYRRAAGQGVPEAAFNLALMLENGQGTAPDLEGAAELYERAYAEGLSAAALNRGLLALKGLEPDRVAGLAWLLRAERAGVPQAAAAVTAVTAELGEAERREAAALAEREDGN